MTATTTATTATVKIGDLIPALKNMRPLFGKNSSELGGTLTVDIATDTATVTHTNYEVTTVATLPAGTHHPGTFTVAARQFTTGVEKLVGTVTKARAAMELPLTVDDTHVACTFDGITTHLPTVDPSGTPTLEPVTGTWAHLTSSDLTAMWTTVKKARCTDPHLPMLAGVNMHIDGEHATFSTTDRFRAAEHITPVIRPDDTTGEHTALIPGAAMQRLIAHLPSTDATVTIRQRGCQLSFVVNNVEVITHLLDGSFPNLGPLFPTTADYFITVDRAELANKVKKMAAQVSRDNIILTLDGTALHLDLSEAGEDNRRVTSTMDAHITPSARETNRYGFNTGYLVDALTALTGDTVTFALREAGRPVLLFNGGVDAGDGDMSVPHCGTRVLLMPARIA